MKHINLAALLLLIVVAFLALTMSAIWLGIETGLAISQLQGK